MRGSWRDLTAGSSIGAEFVGDHASWRAALLLQQALQQAFGRFGIAPRLDDFVEDIAVLVDGSPEPVLLARNRDYDLVKMPDVMPAGVLRRRRRAYAGPNFSAHRRTVS